MRLPICLLLLVAAGPTWADACDDLPKPSVTIKRIEERLEFNVEYSFKSITNIGASLARPGKQILGLTRGKAQVAFTTTSPSIIDPTGRWECASPQITLYYGFSPVMVYIAREFPEGTCAHKEIREHEMRHVEAYRAQMDGIEKEITERLNRRFATGAPWRGPVGQTASRLQQELNSLWVPYVQRLIKRVDEDQAKIDTPEEYERVSNACNGEIKAVLGTR